MVLFSSVGVYFFGVGAGVLWLGVVFVFLFFLGGMRVFLSILLSLRVMVGGGCDFCGF